VSNFWGAYHFTRALLLYKLDRFLQQLQKDLLFIRRCLHEKIVCLLRGGVLSLQLHFSKKQRR